MPCHPQRCNTNGSLRNPVLACAIILFQVCIHAFLCETLLRQALAIHLIGEELLYTLLGGRQQAKSSIFAQWQQGLAFQTFGQQKVMPEASSQGG